MQQYKDNYSDYYNATDKGYPFGKAVDCSSPESIDGTPIKASLVNDVIGMMQAIFLGGMGSSALPTGTPEKVGASDVWNAIQKKITDVNTAEAHTRAEAVTQLENQLSEEISARQKGQSELHTALAGHTGNKNNPHAVTKEQVGLGKVPNVPTNDQTPTYSDAVSFATLSSGEKLSIAFAKIKLAITNLIKHIGDKSNPHGVTKKQVGLENCNNTADKDKKVATARTWEAVRNFEGQFVDGSSNVVFFGKSDTAGNMQAKTVFVAGTFSLVMGARINVQFQNGNTVDNPTLTVNNTGTHAIRIKNTNMPGGTGCFDAGGIYEFIFDGTYWVCVSSDIVAKSLGETSSYIKYANGLIKQWGIAQTNGGDTQYINFSLPYTVIPAVFLTPRFDESGTALVVQAYRIDTNRFVCNCKQATENSYYARPISWSAIGF